MRAERTDAEGVPAEIAEPPRILEKQERNAFFESLSVDAKERFLRALEDAAERGASEESAWEEAVVAAETTYPPGAPEA